MSVSPTGKSEGGIRGSQPGSGAFEAVESFSESERIELSGPPDSVWLEYAYRKHHPVLEYLPTKLAEWIGENMQDELGFPDKQDPDKWGVSELNNILQKHVVPDRNGCALHTFGCLEWESELYRGIMRARCYPFKMPKRRFHNMNPQVHHST